ncbi:MAG: ABC transporter ATP-binding protein [Bacteroidales bacterium]|nr:ABC transporter ATP-binding protein [Bacteroidales bacterium]HPO66437.1 ABC transporter ATP-binding protein [Bacteroidales bacterium]
MIEVKNIHKRFGHLEVLKGINLTINQGEVVAIVGPSGAGKTTLLQIMGTLLTPDAGEVLLDNINPFSLNEKALSAFRNTKIGFVFQFHHLLPEFSALENVFLPALIRKTNRQQAERRAKELLTMMRLDHRMHNKPSELSGGEQQRVAVARALMNDPAIVLADEPSGNLDSQNKKELHKLFFELRDKLNQTFVIVTHDTELAEMSDRQIHLVDGHIVE